MQNPTTEQVHQRVGGMGISVGIRPQYVHRVSTVINQVAVSEAAICLCPLPREHAENLQGGGYHPV